MINTQAPSNSAVLQARKWIEQQPMFLDTETTGLDGQSEIVEICIISCSGEILFESLIRPLRPIPAHVSAIHHITDEMVSRAPRWPVVWPTIRTLLTSRPVGIYNKEFDLRMMLQSARAYGLSWRERLNCFCIMELYSSFHSEWDAYHRSNRRFSLEKAGAQFAISIPNAHRARQDTLLARAVLYSIAGLPY